MIRSLHIENFKSLRDTKPLRIAPLTFLVGSNSSGKSSLLHALLMLKQTVDSRDVQNPLLINGPYVNLGTYSDFIYRHNVSESFKVSVEFDSILKFGMRRPLRSLGDKISLRLSFRYSKAKMQVLLEETCISNIPKTYELRISRGKRTSYTSKITIIKNGDVKEGLFKGAKPFKFYGMANRPPRTRRLFGLYDINIFVSQREIEALFEAIFYIGPLRAWPKRFYVAAGETPQDVGLSGEFGVDVLLACRYTKIKRLRGLLEKVKKWVSDFNIGLDVKLKRIGRGNYYQLVIIDPKTKIEANLPDVGFGVSQILPVIIEGHYAAMGSTLLIEQPEIHLHPKAQAILGDLLISITKERKSLIVETHSEHIISRVRKRIAEGYIKKDDVAIHYFNTTPEGTQVEEITLNDLGQLEKWPEGFFEEDFQEAIDHFKIIASKKALENE